MDSGADHPVVSRPRLDVDFPRLPDLRVIRLFGTSADEWQVTNLVIACPTLVELVVKFAGGILLKATARLRLRTETRMRTLGQAPTRMTAPRPALALGPALTPALTLRTGRWWWTL